MNAQSNYSDDENNNDPDANSNERTSKESMLPRPMFHEERGVKRNPIIKVYIVFALLCMLYSLYTTSLLIFFLSGNAYGILHDASPNQEVDLPNLFVMDIGLLCLFVIQHAFMASDRYKRFISEVVPEYLQRTLYILFTGLIIQVLTNLWVNSMPNASLFIWDFSRYSNVVFICQMLHLFAWIHTFAVVFMLDFSEFMGLKQVYYKVNNFGCPLSAKTPEVQRLFRHFRHATVSGLMIVFWIVPCLTLDRLLLASVFTLFLFSTKIDEHDSVYVRKMYKLKKVAIKCHSSPDLH